MHILRFGRFQRCCQEDLTSIDFQSQGFSSGGLFEAPARSQAMLFKDLLSILDVKATELKWADVLVSVIWSNRFSNEQIVLKGFLETDNDSVFPFHWSSATDTDLAFAPKLWLQGTIISTTDSPAVTSVHLNHPEAAALPNFAKNSGWFHDLPMAYWASATHAA